MLSSAALDVPKTCQETTRPQGMDDHRQNNLRRRHLPLVANILNLDGQEGWGLRAQIVLVSALHGETISSDRRARCGVEQKRTSGVARASGATEWNASERFRTKPPKERSGLIWLLRTLLPSASSIKVRRRRMAY